MARPLKTGCDYFPHDTDASEDEKIAALRSAHGNDGYAVYFILLERIFRRENPEINLGNKLLRGAVAQKCGIDGVKFDAILKDALELGLFDAAQYAENGVLTSDGIKRRHLAITEQRAKWREKKGVFPQENLEKTPEKTPQSKGNKRTIDTQAQSANFDAFYAEYPKHRDKQKAQKAFIKLNPNDDQFSAIMTALEQFQHSPEWRKNNGQFIPYPATWLNDRRWEDDAEQCGEDYSKWK